MLEEIKELLKTIPEDKYDQDIQWNEKDKCGCLLGHMDYLDLCSDELESLTDLWLYFLTGSKYEIEDVADALQIPFYSFSCDTAVDVIKRIEILEKRWPMTSIDALLTD